jgi:hypothetical protein
MRARRRKGWLFLGALVGATIGAVLAFTIFAGIGAAARTVKPENDKRPTISGTAQEGKTLTGDRGTWKNNPTDFDYFWTRCNKTGDNCSDIKGAHALTYVVAAADVDKTLRFKVLAKNSDGQTTESSIATDIVQKAAGSTTTTTTPKSSRGPGCPPGGNPDQVANIASPAQLLVDTLQSDPRVAGFSTQTLVVRFHVTSSCGGPVQGALVYATATPFNQFSIPPEATTGADGLAELRFQRLSGFPVSRKQGLIAIFVRARKPGENLLGGISTRRLVSLRVNRNG